ncbi:MAG: hypothetical protein DBX59_09725 [Bacillota bacterium]|nr:MAG: hypothetical protein DBX59_09725 [Bacillota bacterium]
MLKISGAKAFIEDVRALDDSLAGIKLCSIHVKKEQKEVVYRFICERTVPEDVQQKVADFCMDSAPKSFRFVQTVISKVVADEELVRNAVYKFIERSFPSLTFDFSKEDISAEGANGLFRYKLRMIPASCAYVKGNGTLKQIDAYLERNFCDSFAGEAEEKEQKEHVELSAGEIRLSSLSVIDKRAIRVSDVVVIDDATAADTAVYIEDSAEAGEVTLCGVVTGKREKTTKNGKIFYIFDFEDGTGKASGVYFTKKNTAERVARIETGQAIIARCKYDYFKDRLSLTLERINLCTFPADFKPEPKRGKGVPLEYSLVKPRPAEEVREVSLFDAPEALPAALTDNTFVVFDIETTGTEVTRDEITEIGAVKIENGRICELFQTLVKPQQHISDFIVELTGIDDALVADAPAFKDVVGDFYKFCHGAILVAHNADFDVKFIRAHAKPFDYFFRNKVADTLQLAREILPDLSNHKLNTVAEHYNVKFLHHRALSDAYATAQVFIEMMKSKKKLPDLL